MRCSMWELLGPHHRDRIVDIVEWAQWAERNAAADRAGRQK